MLTPPEIDPIEFLRSPELLERKVAFRRETARIRSRLKTLSRNTRQFRSEHVKLTLQYWQAWRIAGGDYEEAAEMFRALTGRHTIRRQHVVHAIARLRKYSIIAVAESETVKHRAKPVPAEG
jgi:hypothetical protein